MITKVILEVKKDTEIVLSINEAKELYYNLRSIFGNYNYSYPIFRDYVSPIYKSDTVQLKLGSDNGV